MDYYMGVLKNYTKFSGRARRKEYWMFVLINLIISIILGIIASVIRFQALTTIYALAILIPSLAVGVRRLHDTNRSGWWYLIALIPVIGAIVLIVFLATEGQAETNKYGSNPKVAPVVASTPQV